MSSLAWASELYIIGLGKSSAFLVPDSDGVPTLAEPQPHVLRAVYIGQDSLDAQLPNAQSQLLLPHCHLFRLLPSPDGPPYRSGMIFVFQSVVSGLWKDGSCISPGSQMQKYIAATPHGDPDWVQDARRGRPGYLVTGRSVEGALWRLFRLEADAFGHQILTIAPVRFSPRCPLADFSSVADAAAKAELAAQYEDFCQSVAGNAYRDAPTKARNIVEELVSLKLSEQGHPIRRDLWADLQTVKGLLKPPTRDSCGWSDLEYHLAHKIRLLHAQTHIGNVVESGRAIRPEFALTVAEDLAELMRIWGYVR